MALSHTDTPKRRRITGKSLPASPAPAGSDPWKDPNDIEVVFKDYHGAARIERIFEVFGDPKGESMDIGWFTDGQPNVVSDPVNRPLQQATVLEYEARIFESGLADDCSGLPWLRWSPGPKQRNYPLLALSFNHRRAAFYGCFEKNPWHPMVVQTLKQGLRRARILHKDTPNYVIKWMCDEHNRHHSGSGVTPLAIVEEALNLEASWRRKCSTEGITTRHSEYQRLYDGFVRNQSSLFRESISLFQDAKSLGHTMQNFELQKEFEDWHLAHGDFLCGVPPGHSVSMMCQMSNIVVKSLRNFHSQADIQAVLGEALKFCVPSTSNGSQRAIPHIFRPGFSDKNMMANITIPMENSVAFKKLIRKKAQREEDERLRHMIEEDLERQLDEATAARESRAEKVKSAKGDGSQPAKTRGEKAESQDKSEESDDEEDDEKPDADAAAAALRTAKQEKRGKKIRKKLAKDKSHAERKAKASKKAGGKDLEGKKVEVAKPTKGLEEADSFDTNILALKGSDSRTKHALDDFLSTLSWARSNLATEISDEEASRSKRFLLSLFLELAWGCSVACNGKLFKQYSSFREESHVIFYAAHQKLTVNEKKFDPLKLAQDLLHMVSGPVVPESSSDGHNDEESMLNFIRNFSEALALRGYISSHLHLPSSMHEKLTQFRQKLGSSMKEFRDLPDFKAQLAYFFDLFTELKIVPAPWLIYGACAAYLHQKTGGRLVESTASTFESSEVLAQFCGMRARYVILGLKDLFNMKILKCSEEIGKSISEMASELDTNQSCGLESFSSSGDGAGVTFVSAITAFDAELAHEGDMNWTDQWVKLLGACVSVSTGAAAIRDLRGVPKKVKWAEIDKKAESKEPEKSEDVDPEISAAKRKLKEGQSTEDLKDKKDDDANGSGADEGKEDEDYWFVGYKKALIPLELIHMPVDSAKILEADESQLQHYCPGNVPELRVKMTSSWLKIVEKGIESLLWRLYQDVTAKTVESHVMYVADPQEAGLKSSEKCVLVNCPPTAELLFCGPVSTEPSKDALKIGQLGEITFYMHPPQLPPQGDVVVPAWLAKPTHKRDNVTLEFQHAVITVYVSPNGEVSALNPSKVWEERQVTTQQADLFKLMMSDAIQAAKTKARNCKEIARQWKGECESRESDLKAAHEEVSRLKAILGDVKALGASAKPKCKAKKDQSVQAPGTPIPEHGDLKADLRSVADATLLDAETEPVAKEAGSPKQELPSEVLPNEAEEPSKGAVAADPVESVSENGAHGEEESKVELGKLCKAADTAAKPSEDVAELGKLGPSAQPAAVGNADENLSEKAAAGASESKLEVGKLAGAATPADAENEPAQKCEDAADADLQEPKFGARAAGPLSESEPEDNYCPTPEKTPPSSPDPSKAEKPPSYIKIALTTYSLTIAEKHAGSETPLPLVRAMTPEEVAAKAAKSKKEVAWPSVRCGLGAAMDLREKQLEAEGQETAASKKRRRKEEAGNDRSQALKMVNGAHLLK